MAAVNNTLQCMLSIYVCVSSLLRFCNGLFTDKKNNKADKGRNDKTKSRKNIGIAISKTEIKLALDGLQNHTDLLYSPQGSCDIQKMV